MNRPERPLAMVAELTYRCPLKCPYCSNPLQLERYREELDPDAWCRVLREAAALGVVQVHFSGGEPMLRHDLPRLIATARQAGLYSNLSTGATRADAEMLRTLKESGLDALQVSLLDATPLANDHLAGMPSFEQKRRAVEEAHRLGFPVTLNVVLHRQNLDRISEILSLANDWGVHRLELAHAQYVGWALRNRAALLPSEAQLRDAQATVDAWRARDRTSFGGKRPPRILHVLPDYYQEVPKACLNGWGRVFLTVAPDGAVLPCQAAREIPGLEFPNVRHQGLEQIWFASEVFNRFRGTQWMPLPCRDCERREVDFGGCRCQAYLLTGDAAATDPVCHLAPEHSIIVEALTEARREPPAFQYRVMRS
jgi:pyrroloquinoline quinone biosynthesis protein E